MAAPLVRQKVPPLESSTRIKRAEEYDQDVEGRDAIPPSPPTGRVEMKIPRGMPVLPGGRRMPPLPVRLRETLEPLRRSLAPIRRSLAPLLGASTAETSAPDRVSDVTPVAQAQARRWPWVAALILVAAAVAAAWLVLGVRR